MLMLPTPLRCEKVVSSGRPSSDAYGAYLFFGTDRYDSATLVLVDEYRGINLQDRIARMLAPCPVCGQERFTQRRYCDTCV